MDMKSLTLAIKHGVVGAALAIVAVFLISCGDPTAELLEGLATRVASGEPTPLPYEGVLCVNEARINVLIADTTAERAAGLSGYRSLPEDAGMLFIFPGPTQPAFWMKGMRMSIDIIWISYVAVVQIDAAVLPPAEGSTDDQLLRYRPSQPITHVLEVPAGAAERHGITVGSRIAPCTDATSTPQSSS
jgi:hypothetical protein